MGPDIAGAPKRSSRASSAAPSRERWTVRRKAAIVKAVRGGRVSLDEICRAYKLSFEELLAWERDMNRDGAPGLRATRYQIYRQTDKRKAG
jgi:transposase-like protein